MKELEQINRKLRAQNQDLEDFCTIVAHDLRGSVSGIVQSALWVQEGIAQYLTEDLNQRFDLLVARTLWLDTLISDLLTYSRVGQMEHHCEPVFVADLLRHTIDFLAPPPAISIEISANMPILLTERVPLQIVFSNLIGNAIQHRTQPQGRIEITAIDRADVYEFSIIDDGMGIAIADQEKIFEIFTALPISVDVAAIVQPAEQSTGIGLAIAKKAVERNGGEIWVESQVGIGSTFRFTWAKSKISI
jgi:signal transduction histidine kinase